MAGSDANSHSTSGYAGDGGLATLAQLANPQGLGIDATGDIIIGDTNNFVVRMVTSPGSAFLP